MKMSKDTDLLPKFLVPYIIASFEYKGHKCFIAKHEIDEGEYGKKHWYCGYALIDKDVPFFNVAKDIDVHGGVTFNKHGLIGFDCNHVGDDTGYFKPAYRKWDVDKVKQEIMKMVDGYLELEGKTK